MPPLLHASGTAIVEPSGSPIVLKGCNLGNWLLVEPWMLSMWRPGDPKDQYNLEQLLIDRFGAEKEQQLMDLYRANWITERDFTEIKSWGFNVVRLPFDSQLLEDEAHPGQLKPDAFKWLDRALQFAEGAGIYVILDMHGTPGGQSLAGTTGRSGQNKLWLPENQERAATLWAAIAKRYKDRSIVAGYDLINEPFGNQNMENMDDVLVATVSKIMDAIRAVDPKHVVFCPGSLRGIACYGTPASHGWTNVAFTEHFYPGVYTNDASIDNHARFIGRDIAERAALLSQLQVPYLVGEFNVVFDRAGGKAMMRRYYDEFASHQWAATMWSYKLIKSTGGSQSNNWYMVTNRDPIHLPNLRTAPLPEIEKFLTDLSTMNYAEDTDFKQAMLAPVAPSLVLDHFDYIKEPAPQELLSGWTTSDVGNAFPHGGLKVMSDDSAVTLYGGGRDIFQGNDEFHYLSRPACDQVTLSATTSPPLDTNQYAKAGLMFRENDDPQSPMAMVALTPNGKCTFAYRTSSGEQLTQETMSVAGETVRLMLARTGSAITATELDSAGKQISSKSYTFSDLQGAGTLGLFVCSHDPMTLSDATFTHIDYVPATKDKP